MHFNLTRLKQNKVMKIGWEVVGAAEMCFQDPIII